MKSLRSLLVTAAGVGVAGSLLAGPAVAANAADPAPATPLVSASAPLPRFAPVYMGWANTVGVSAATAVSLAQNFDVVAATAGQLRFHVADMKAANPNVEIVGYVNGLYTRDTTLPESEYAHDATGARITTEQFGQWLMNPSSPQWQASVVSACTSLLKLAHYDGCFVDNLGTGPFSPGYTTGVPVDPTTGVAWDKDAWMAATTSVTRSVEAAVPGGIVISNGIGNGARYFDTTGGATAGLARASSGGMVELFLRGPTTALDAFPAEKAWKANVDMLADAAATGAALETTTKVWRSDATADQVNAWHRYAVASFLMGASGGRISFNFSAGQSWTALTATTAWDRVNLGQPLGGYAKNATNVYYRAFSGGLVLVNPTKKTGSYPLTGSYVDPDGNRYSAGTLTLAPNQVAVLQTAS